MTTDEQNETCHKCGKDGLHWHPINPRVWRLYDGDEMHVCKEEKEENE